MRFIFLSLMLVPVVLTAQVQKAALFVGNSYTATNNLPGMVQNLAASKGSSFSYHTITPGGFIWSDHRYSSTTMAAIDTIQYDYLILQEQSLQMGTNKLGFAKHQHLSFRNADIINHQSKLSDVCRKTMLYLTWGRKNGNTVYEPGGKFGSSYTDMQDYLTENYMQLAYLLEAEVSPVGEAWRKAMEDCPQIELYAADGSHPSVAGTYLAACVFYSALFHETSSMGWQPNGLSAAVAQQLQAVADEIVLSSLSTWNIDNSNHSCTSSKLLANNDQWSSTFLNRDHLSEVRFTNNEHGYVRGTGPSVWQTIDAGDTWNPVALPEESVLDAKNETSFDITFLNKDTIWYVISADEVDSSTVIHQPFEGSTGDYISYLKLFFSDDGGISWSERSPERNLYEIAGSGYLDGRPRFWNMSLDFDEDGQNGTLLCNYEYVSNRTVIHSFSTNDGGLNWNQHRDTLEHYITGVFWPKNVNEAYISGYKYTNQTNADPQRIYRTNNRGLSWDEIATLPNNCCQKLSGYIWHYFSAFNYVGEDTLLAVNSLSNPTFYRSINNGSSWETVTSITAIGKAAGILEPVNGVYYLLMNNDPVNRILVSYDYGQTWQLEAYFDEPLRGMTFTDNFMYVVGGRGSVHRKPISWISSVGSMGLSQGNIMVYPNPSSGEVNLTGVQPKSVVIVFNSHGMLIRKYNSDLSNRMKLQLQNVSNGIYVLRIQSTSGTITKKVIIQN